MDTLHSQLRERDFLVGEQRKGDARLRDIAKKQDEVRRIAAMQSVPGIGSVVATTFAAEVFRPRRFD
jgi:transposase